MSLRDDEKIGWFERVVYWLKPEADDIGCGCVWIFLSSIVFILLFLLVPPILENWERPIKIGDIGRLLAVIVVFSAFYFPSKFIFSESKATLREKFKVFSFYVVWLFVVLCVFEHFLDGRGLSLANFFHKDSFRYLR